MHLFFFLGEGTERRFPSHQADELSSDVDASRLIAILSQIAILLLAQTQSSNFRPLWGAEGRMGTTCPPTPTTDLGGVVFGSQGDNEALALFLYTLIENERHVVSKWKEYTL